jgi:hypothetical protein
MTTDTLALPKLSIPIPSTPTCTDRTTAPSAARIVLWLTRHPLKCRKYPAKHERLVTAEELARLGS